MPVKDGAPTDHVDDVSGPAADAEGNLTKATVLKKLRGVCTDNRLLARIDSFVKRGNIICAEAYKFANFHVQRCFLAHIPCPEVRDFEKFYYACLLSVNNRQQRP